MNPTAPLPSIPSVPPALISRNPRAWLAVFGPGAVLASLTIGVGELVFSSRAGALFGYRLLWLFALVLLLKWILVYGSARHMLLTGAHPFQRSLDLPGPRGWFALTFFLLALPCFPIWVCFHAGTLGTLLASLTGTDAALGGAAHLGWGAGLLIATLMLSARGGYQALERVQLAIVLLMIATVIAAVFFMHPDWMSFARGLLVPSPPAYPDWLNSTTHPEIAARPLGLEVITYVGVIGGSSYDYLAYTSYLRDKRWGLAGQAVPSPRDGNPCSPADIQTLRQWLRAPLIDCTLSFAAVLLFTAVFVIGGTVVLGPQHKVPAGSNLLSLQAEFLAVLHPWFRPVYFTGAFLAVLGTLYGTIEVAPAILREMAIAWRPADAHRRHSRLRAWAIGWTGAGGLVVLGWTFIHHWLRGSTQAPGLVAILTPANLFTGVLGCGFICLLNAWMDYRFLPPALRPPLFATVLTLAAGASFVALGLVACWDHSQGLAFAILAASVLVGMFAAAVAQNRPLRPANT